MLIIASLKLEFLTNRMLLCSSHVLQYIYIIQERISYQRHGFTTSLKQGLSVSNLILGLNCACRAGTKTYSVLRFFNCLKEPGCKSLILLNLRSLQRGRKSQSYQYFSARKSAHESNIYPWKIYTVKQAICYVL